MRCFICDRNDSGLSMYHPDHNRHPVNRFISVETSKGSVYVCDVCQLDSDEALGELQLDFDTEVVELIEDTF